MNTLRNHTTLAALFLALAPAVRAQGSDNVTGTSGAVVVWNPPSSLELDQYESSIQISLLAEAADVVLATDLEVDIVQRGAYGPAAASAPGPHVIAAGTRVSSYILHLDKPASDVELSGAASFSRPILGIILSDELLDASDAVLGWPNTVYPTGLATRGLNVTGPDDSLVLADRAVSVNMSVPGTMDQVRILVGNSLTFSIDLGSDAEYADPVPTGDEILDAGDMLLFGADAEPTIYWNDVDHLGVTFPDFPSPAPFGACSGPGGAAVYAGNSDLDGFDEIGLNLATYQGEFPIQFEELTPDSRRAIFPVDSLLISYDDDGARGWPLCNSGGRMPVESASPQGETYGSSADQDEVLRVDVSTLSLPFAVTSVTGFTEEAGIVPGLAPSPTAGSEADDDDVDALDWLSDGPLQYVSVDHEGTGGLNAGAIYATDGVGGVVPVISPAMLGLPDGVDVDAFEFVQLHAAPDDESSPLLLALAFSVDQDDARTVGIDESGQSSDPALNPFTIYYSFLNGTRGVLIDGLTDDVDAIAAGYFYDAPPCAEYVGTAYCSTSLNSAGSYGYVAAIGSLSVDDECLGFQAAALPVGAPGLFYYGTAAVSFPFGNGTRCVGGTTQRLPIRMTDAFGFLREPDVFDVAPTPLSAGTIYVQCWYRDAAAGGSFFNLTDGVEITLLP